ncbi:hypothetical protein [Gulbenkiania mobilis]|uniref:Uncharacterized protein n=1 Tax=Gulbenkiania mobilis TaxID=397457 RepID=A0ABY2CTZ4_GULMO|nr:hypothetical protein EV669_11138 [Gulbenkiania mobilis]
MTEQFPPLRLYLTLEEAAAAISARLGQQWTVSDILDRAANDEISIVARIPTACRLVRCEPMEGKPNEIDVPAGSLPRISAKAARTLLLAPAASFDELTYPRTIDFLGEPLEVMATVWELAPGETAPEFTVTDCRVSGAAVLELEKRYGGKDANKPTPAPAEEGEGWASASSFQPKTSVGKIAVEVAWRIEQGTGRKADAASVMEELNRMASNGDRPDILIEPGVRYVWWLTSKETKKRYTLDACGKALQSWNAGRK